MLHMSSNRKLAATRRVTRRLAALPILGMLLITSGCQFGRQWFQMSSDSMPFFGFDLLPRRSSTRPIAAGDGDALSIQTADDREAGRTSFEPRITSTRDTLTPPPLDQREIIELPELRGRAEPAAAVEVSSDGFSQPFPEPFTPSADN